MSQCTRSGRLRPTSRRASVLVVLAFLLLGAACSGSGPEDSVTGTDPSSDPAPSGEVAASAGAASGDGSPGATLAAPADDPAPSGSALQVAPIEGSSGGEATSTATSSTSTGSGSTVADSTAPGSTTTPSSATSGSATPAGGSGRFGTLPPGSSLPTGAACATRVTPRPEVRAGNASFNRTRGSGPNGRYPRVDGDFVGTTDEIIQWAACKWGIDEDVLRAQAAIESWWDMETRGDQTGDQASCHPELRTSGSTCPESIGLLQVRWLYHSEAFANSDAIRSTAYNVDYAMAVWRSCFEGELGWLNDVERGRDYAAGDAQGCLGVWFSGRWYTDAAVGYIDRVEEYRRSRIWEQSEFLNYG
jgi:hypothetical protein